MDALFYGTGAIRGTLLAKSMTLRKVVAPFIAALGLLHAAGASALGLGELVQLSAIGEPLRVRIQLLGVDANTQPNCLRLAPRSDMDLPWVRDARLAIVRELTGAYLVVSSVRPANHPVLMLGVATGCEGNLRREYTLLLPPKPALEAAPVATEPTPPATLQARPAAAAPAGPAHAVDQPGPSLLDLARQAFPSDRSARRRYIAAARQQAPGMFPSSDSLRAPIEDPSRLDLAELERLARIAPVHKPAAAKPRARPEATPEARRAPPPPVAVAQAAPAEAPPPADSGADRLVLFGGPADTRLKLSFSLSDPGRAGTTTDAERERLREEQRLVMALDEKIMTQMELSARIKELEALQSRLTQESRRLDQLAVGNGATPERGPVATVPPPAQVPPEVSASAADDDHWQTWAIALAAATAAVLALLWWRRRRAEATDQEPLEFDLAEGDLPEAHAPGDGEPLDLGDTGRGMEVDFPLDDEPAAAAVAPDDTREAPNVDFAPLDWAPAADDLSVQGAPPVLEEDLGEEHESAVELADIMMSFGRVQGAAQTLADFIRHNPKQGVAPWIKLLDVYKAAGMRGEFDALTRQLNGTFNVKVVAWDEFDMVRLAAETLESMPHIVERLAMIWPSRTAQVYLHELLRDNRDGTRQGFPIAVVDEILCLLSVLNELVGPFRARPGDFKDDPAQEEG